MTLWSTRKCAKESGYSRGHVRYLARNNEVDSKEVGARMYVIDAESFMDYVERMAELGNSRYSSYPVESD